MKLHDLELKDKDIEVAAVRSELEALEKGILCAKMVEKVRDHVQITNAMVHLAKLGKE